MKKDKIFLSYRRDDIPGYVGRLEDELERAFGEERIFRDVEDIAGGRSWKNVINQNLEQSGAFILVFGPRWAEIWQARQSDPVNYVALELEHAKASGATIIPVSIGGVKLPPDLDLGSVSWLREKQIYDISDQQGRWSSDVSGLIKILEQVPSIGASRLEPNLPTKKKNSGWGLALVALTLVGVGLFYLVMSFSGTGSVQPAPQPDISKRDPDQTPQPTQSIPTSPARQNPSP